VTVAILADGLAPGNPDFVRNHAYGPAGTPVITAYQDFSGDGTAAKTQGAEAFGDASSIAAQGNKAYNISRFVSPGMASLLPAGGCWVKIVGAAPGASVLALKIFGQNGAETGSGFVQAVQYAVQHGAKVINESFGSEPFPDTTLDLVRNADDAAVAAGVTVVVVVGDTVGAVGSVGAPDAGAAAGAAVVVVVVVCPIAPATKTVPSASKASRLQLTQNFIIPTLTS